MLRACDLQIRGGVTVTAGNAVPAAGELAVFCRPVVTAPAMIRRDGRMLAGGWLPDFVRLGELERQLGDGVIESVAGAAVAQGRLKKRQRRRLMSYPLVIRLMLAMALMPDASYCQALARLAGLLADVPFALAWHVPTEKVVTGWRALASIDLAVIRLRSGALDAAVASLEPALSLAPAQRIAPLTGRLELLRKELAAPVFRQSAQARDLDERIEEFSRDAVTAGLHTLHGGAA